MADISRKLAFSPSCPSLSFPPAFCPWEQTGAAGKARRGLWPRPQVPAAVGTSRDPSLRTWEKMNFRYLRPPVYGICPGALS